MKSGLITGLVQEADIDQILELNRIEYGKDDILATRIDFDWRYRQNPAGEAVVPVVRDEHNNIIGFIWVVPLQLRIKGKNYLAATGTNLVTHPRYRNSFAYIKLLRRFEQVFNDNDIPLHFSFISEASYQKQQQHSPRRVLTVPLLIKPLNIQSLAQTYFKDKITGILAGHLGQIASPFLFRQEAISRRDEITIDPVEGFDKRFDDFWLQIKDKYPVMTIRDRDYLSWRFAEISGRKYCILVARMENQMLGYTVLRCSTIRGITTGLVMDLLVSNDELGESAGVRLLLEAERYFRNKNMSLAAGLMPRWAAEYRILRRAGYARLSQLFSPRSFYFAFYLHDANKDSLVSLLARDWFITIADYESF